MMIAEYRNGDEHTATFKDESFHITGRAWSVWNRDRLIAIIGGATMWGDVCVVYAHVSSDIRQSDAVGLIRACIECMRRLVLSDQYKKLQAFVDANNTINVKFIKTLGFRQEGLMPLGMPDGSDCAIFGRTI